MSRILLFLAFIIALSSCRSNAPKVAEEAPTAVRTKSSNERKEVQRFPEATGFVNDFEYLFSDVELAELTRRIVDFRKETGNVIAIVTIDSIGDYTNFDLFARDLSNAWGVGEEGKDNGLTIVLSDKLREVRISTGKGTEKLISNEFCSSVVGNTLVPAFQDRQYYSGIAAGLTELMNAWRSATTK